MKFCPVRPPPSQSPKPPWVMSLILMVSLCSPSWATTATWPSPQSIYQAIERAQTQDPESYMTSADFPVFSDGAQPASADRLWLKPKTSSNDGQCTDQSTDVQVYGAAWLDGKVLDYTIDFKNRLVHVDYLGQSQTLSAQDLVGYQDPEGWPCAVPIAAVVCAISGGAFCGWRITQCYKAAERCPCGVAVYNCGVCGEGRGVTCQPCPPVQQPLPDLRPIFPWPVSWGNQ